MVTRWQPKQVKIKEKGTEGGMRNVSIQMVIQDSTSPCHADSSGPEGDCEDRVGDLFRDPWDSDSVCCRMHHLHNHEAGMASDIPIDIDRGMHYGCCNRNRCYRRLD